MKYVNVGEEAFSLKPGNLLEGNVKRYRAASSGHKLHHGPYKTLSNHNDNTYVEAGDTMCL